ncbi:hypothetical protein EPUS_01187 [Endocarpon pusillum Z07020]|uniref:RING-type domain-containing protein n=1 Tax=Endocarpon pusillum (strain Z07020 / HMAS-L-300199) TaxID=1263415 RepID=U1HGH4_ENDPU|nr:uncharacterized protein EPUS_01187 [Endocarpon pusillum Z07020]ERF69230.1 hypothetical protein EPUS_01187 [Endocarpon pusillum Z07020]
MVLPFDLLKTPTRPPASQRPSSSSSVLQEALRLNPFASRTETNVLTKTAKGEETDRVDLNNDLITLSGLFPDLQFEVLREVLVKFPGDSRLRICVDQLLTHRTQWARGRWHAPPRDIEHDVPLHASFRSTEYKSATLQLLSHEFRYLSKSTIEGVLAENNFSYTGARPTLKDLSTRTWRATLGNLNIFKKRRENDVAPTALLGKSVRADGSLNTGSIELDEELQESFLEPAKRKENRRQEEQDRKVAEELNEAEARSVGALHECECCCGEATFEKMSSCTTGGHLVCFECIRRTVHEALFGQGWGRSIDPDRGALKCLAPIVDDICTGVISQPAVREAIRAEGPGVESWTMFEDRLAQESLLKSQLTLTRCPFCSYAEADPSEVSHRMPTPAWHLKSSRSITTLLVMVVIVDLLPVLLFVFVMLSVSRLIEPIGVFHASLHRLALRNRSPRFKCRHPACLKTSCLKCQKAWHDPHTCHEPLLISLRTTIEAARTAAIKRTCPRCGLSFVKASGCNKLTCVCGYSMCYLCRTALGAPSLFDYPRARRPVEDTHGYRHFCEHFRVNPGQPCTECQKCDLYRSEDEDAIANRAGEIAEREWRVKEGMVGVGGLGEMPGHQRNRLPMAAMPGGWTLQSVVDWTVAQLIEVEV